MESANLFNCINYLISQNVFYKINQNQFKHKEPDFYFLQYQKKYFFYIFIYYCTIFTYNKHFNHQNQQPSLMSHIFLAFMIIILLWYASPAPIEQASYTQNLAEFKGKDFNARSEKLLGCFLYIRGQPIEKPLNQQQMLYALKQCIRKISRKSSVLKITQLAKRNMQAVPPFSTIMKLDQVIKNTPSHTQYSQFDRYLIQRSNEFKEEILKIEEKGDISKQVQEELKKKQKFYFGFIPAGMINHTTIVISLTLIMMCCCTWCKFSNVNSERLKSKKLKQASSNSFKQQADQKYVRSALTKKIKQKGKQK